MADFQNLIKVLGHLKMAENLLEEASQSDKSILGAIDFGHLVDMAKEVSDYMAMNVDLYPPAESAETPQICDVTAQKASNRAKLTEDDVRAIVGLLKNGFSQQEIAKRFNVCDTCISKIATGKTWSHVTHINHTPKRAAAKKLDEDKVKTIIGLIHAGCDFGGIAKRFGVTPKTISDIAAGKTWRSVKRPFNFKVKGVIQIAA